MINNRVAFWFVYDLFANCISHFSARDTSNMVTKLYLLTKNGRDDENCLHQATNCKTIGFILENECHSDVNLAISLKYQEDYTHAEPCRNYNTNFSNSCSVTIFGEGNSQKPKIILEENTGQGCILFQTFWTSNQTSRNDSWVCSEHSTCKHNDRRPVFRFEDLVVSSSILHFPGQVDFSANNVVFVDSQVNVDGLSRMPCSFHCTSCSFSTSTTAPFNRGSQLQSQIRLSHCLDMYFELYHCFISNTALNLSFLYVGCVHMYNISCDQIHNESNDATSVQIQQMDAPLWPEHALLQTILTFENILFGKSRSRHLLFISLQNSINPRSEFVFKNCTSARSSGLLKYTVSSNENINISNSVHKLSLSDTYVTGANSKNSVIQIQNKAAGIIVFARCFFSYNVFPKASPLIDLSVRKTLVFFVETKLANNIGGVKVFANDATSGDSSTSISQPFFSSDLSDFFNETSSSFYDNVSMVVQKSAIQVYNCIFVNSQSSSNAGGFSLQVRHNSVYKKFPFVVQIKNCLFRNLTNKKRSGGAIRINFQSNKDLFALIFGSLGRLVSSEKYKIEILISDCQFISNSAKNGGALWLDSGEKWSFFLVIKFCYYERNVGQDGGAIKLHNQCSSNFSSFVEISLSQFSENVATGKGSAISTTFVCTSNQHKMKFNLRHIMFSDNVVQENELSEKGGGTLLFIAEMPPTTTSISIKETNWENNTSTGHGGALALHIYESSSVHITKSHFISNSAGLTSFGGACYFNVIKLEEIGVGQMIQINQSVFHNNTAAEGGSVFQTSSLPLDIKFGIAHSIFHCCSSVDADFVSMTTSTCFKNVQFYYVLATEDLLVPGLLLKHQGPYLLDNVYFTCYHADITLYLNSISTLHGKHHVTNLTSLSASCTKCTKKPFPEGNGILFIDQGAELSFSETNVTLTQNNIHLKSPCTTCPFGGECLDNKVKALPNYWGYKHKESIVFLQCPLYYCCNNIDVSCDSHDTCAQHRTGQLCGGCENGFSESLMSTVCIPDTKCDDWWVWPVGFLLAFAYLLWYMYKGTIQNLFILTIHKIHSHIFQNSNKWATKLSKSAEEDRNKQDFWDTGKAENAYFDILVYFVNIISLIKVQVELQTSDSKGVLHYIEEYFMKYLDIDAQQIVNVEICPFPGLDATSKTLARPVFSLMVLIVWCVLFASSSIVLWILSSQKFKLMHFIKLSFTQFNLKLVEGFIQTIKYSYSGLAKATFIFIACIRVGDHTFWKYNAEVECYSSLQKTVFIFAAFYTIPLVLISPVGGKLLRARTVNYIQVMLACIFPFPFVVIWGLYYQLGSSSCKNQVFPNSKDDAQSNFPTTNNQHQQGVLEGEAQVILDTYQGAYKDEYSYWEGVVEIRKLIFCSFYLVSDNIYRLMFCTLTSVIVLVHHKSVYPFKNINSNRAETLSLSLLCLACVTNSVKSVFPELGFVIEQHTPIEQLLFVINRLDKILSIILVLYILTAEMFDTVRGKVLAHIEVKKDF